ncbi:MAG: pilus assembly protein PilS, partial [Flavobacteriaceae bacterium]|nr:pilus assembly protein PilS [Flavobacteriaceae bacterium]
MSDQDEDKKNIIDDNTSSENNNQPEIDSNNQSQVEENQNLETTPEGNQDNLENKTENENLDDLNDKKEQNFSSEQRVEENLQDNNQNLDQTNQEADVSNDNKENNTGTSHEVIHKKDGRLHIYVRQDKYKGELKSKNWVGRLYIDGKQKISSSGTANLEEAIPILEKWFDDVHEESERLKNQTKEEEISTNEVVPEQNATQNNDQTPIQPSETETTLVNQTNENNEPSKQDQIKSKLSNVFGKLKDIKLKKTSSDNVSSKASFNKSKMGGFKSKISNFFKSKLGKSSVQGEEILGVELANTELRLVQVSSNKANQWVLEKLHIHPVDVTDDSTPIENADKFSEELSLAIQKYKISSPNVAISIPVTSAIIRVVTAPLMKDEELNKAIETNSLWENLVQLTDSLDDYSIFHQVINRNQKDNTMDILFVASKLTDINSYTSIIKNAGLNPVIIDVKCFALKSAVDQSNQLTNKFEDSNLTAVLEFGLDENYLMILYDNNPIITDIFIRGQDRKILQESEDAEEKEGLVRRYATQVKQAIQDFET